LADQERPAGGAPAEPETYDRWSRRQALSGRGYVLAVLIPLLIAAAGFGLVSLVASGNDSATRVRVPTSDWIPGQPTGSTRIEGQLTSDSRHCVYLQSADGTQVWPVWPAGYYGELDSQGNVSLYDDKHQLVARSGQRVQASGATVSSAGYTGEACLPDDKDVELVQSEVVATR
jgi:hypothetical protein